MLLSSLKVLLDSVALEEDLMVLGKHTKVSPKLSVSKGVRIKGHVSEAPTSSSGAAGG